jgi:hypothetical protein
MGQAFNPASSSSSSSCPMSAPGPSWPTSLGWIPGRASLGPGTPISTVLVTGRGIILAIGPSSAALDVGQRVFASCRHARPVHRPGPARRRRPHHNPGPDGLGRGHGSAQVRVELGAGAVVVGLGLVGNFAAERPQLVGMTRLDMMETEATWPGRRAYCHAG